MNPQEISVIIIIYQKFLKMGADGHLNVTIILPVMHAITRLQTRMISTTYCSPNPRTRNAFLQ
jgi:hypothetical protein